MNLRIFLTCIIVALLGPVVSICNGSHLDAQAINRPTRVPVTLALVDSIPEGSAPFQIIRRVDLAPHDVILLPSSASQDALSEAIGDLLTLRSIGGDTATDDGMVRVRRPQPAAGRPPRPLPWAGRVMNDLRRAQPRHVAGVGMVPAVEVWLPPQRKRQQS